MVGCVNRLARAIGNFDASNKGVVQRITEHSLAMIRLVVHSLEVVRFKGLQDQITARLAPRIEIT